MMKKVKDERVVQTTNKILSEAYFVIMLLLIVSIVVKTYVMGEPFTHYITEIGVIIVSAIYIAIRSMLTGNNLMDTSKRNKILTVFAILGLSLVVTASNGVKNYSNYGEQYSGIFDFHFLAVLAVTFLSSAALISIVLLFIYICHIRGQRKLEKQIRYDDDEE
ncbi:DUF6773 family protein [Zhenpiania hominis]|uniref:Uncharacterized protein n=1 Tax=Zhenpiania hominis TaxID=2763644 RepID=A0A923NRK1_9FIRM|nr:DUF6773 family protein [Zhenpiania hominis]MBC6681410.1 hypothetical protein [Zhenpiania hominis]